MKIKPRCDELSLADASNEMESQEGSDCSDWDNPSLDSIDTNFEAANFLKHN
jgi:hypothetical protein